MLSATSILLAFWLAVVLLCDIDGFKRGRRRQARANDCRQSAAQDPQVATSHALAGAPILPVGSNPIREGAGDAEGPNSRAPYARERTAPVLGHGK